MAIISDGKGGIGDVAEAPLDAANQDYAKTSPGMGGFLSAFNRAENPLASTLVPRAEQSQFREHDWFREYLNSFISEGGSTNPRIEYQASPKLTPEQANKQFPNPVPDGKPLFDKPIDTKLAETIAKHKGQQFQAESDVARFEQNNSFPVRFGASIVASLMDPLNLSLAFVPGLGEEAMAARGLGLAGRMAFRSGEFAGLGAATEAPIAGLKLGFSDDLHTDYGIRHALSDMLMATAGGAVLGGAFGAGAEAIRSIRGRPNPAAAQAIPVAAASAETNHAAASSAVSQLVTGRPVDVEGFFPRPQSDTAVAMFLDHPYLKNIEPAELGLDRREVARTIEPKIMAAYEAAEQRHATLAAKLDELNQARTRGETNAGQLAQDQIDQLESQLAGKLSKAKRAAAESKLADLKSEQAKLPSNDDMLAVQKQVQEADNHLRDMVAAIGPVMERADQSIARATAAESATRLDDLLAKQRQFMRPDYQSMIEREKGWRKTGTAPGISHDDLVTAQAEVAHGAQNAPVAPTPKKMPEGFGQAAPVEAATAAKGPEATTVAPKGKQAPTAAPERFDSASIKRDHTTEGGAIDLAAAGDEIATRVHDALADGDKVIFHAEGKEVPITSVDARNQMRDAEGKPWGVMLIASDASKRNRIEITPRAADPFPGLDMTKLSAEEKAILMDAHKDLEAATLREGAYDEAALCLKAGG